MSTTIAFTGDICFSHYFKGCEESAGFLSPEVKQFIQDADYCIGNVEGPIIHYQDNNRDELSHCSAYSAGSFLSKNGINIWNLANNHIYDFWDQGIAATFETCAAYECKSVGIQKKSIEKAPFVIYDAGGIGIVSVCYSAPKMKERVGEYEYLDWDDNASISEAINRIKTSCKWCILIAHGGDEFSRLPMPETRSRYLRYLDMGVDIVVAHHPHVVQNYEFVGNKVVFYSLGNFIFDTDYERAHEHTDTGVILKIKFMQDEISWTHLATRIDRKAHRIVPGSTPPVFTCIDGEQYARLLPFASKTLSKEERITLAYVKPGKYKNASALFWLLRDLRLFGYVKRRERIVNKYKSIFLKPPHSELADYILE